MNESWKNEEGLTLTSADVKQFCKTGQRFLFALTDYPYPQEGQIKSHLEDGELVAVTSGSGYSGMKNWFRRTQLSILTLIPPPMPVVEDDDYVMDDNVPVYHAKSKNSFDKMLVKKDEKKPAEPKKTKFFKNYGHSS
jgi:hypothetical protein